MARSKKAKATKAAGGAASAAAAARNNQYVQRIMSDSELRDNARVAYECARRAYDRLQSNKSPTKALTEDKKVQKELRNTANALRHTTTALRDGPKKRKRSGGFGRKLLVLVVGAGAALALSEGLRNKVLDALFGAEEEFEYTSTTAPATPAPAGSTS